MRCDLCRFPCKEKLEKCAKFYPQEHILGYSVHFKEDSTKHYGKHDKTSRMCVVCKDYFHCSNIRWIKVESRYYPECLSCALRSDYIRANVLVG